MAPHSIPTDHSPPAQLPDALGGLVAPALPTARTFEAVCEAQPQRTAREIRDLDAKLAARGVQFAGKTHQAFLAPDVISVAETERLKHIIPLLMGCVERAIAWRPHRADLAGYFGVSESLRPLIDIDPRVKTRAVVFARLDGFLNGEHLQFIEFNVDSPAGPGYADIIEELIVETPSFQEFLASGASVRRISRRQRLLVALLDYYREWRGNVGTIHHAPQPNIAITDWEGVSTASEFRILADYFESQGFACSIVDPRAFTISRRPGGPFLEANGRRIDLVYRRALVQELAQRRRDIAALETAAREGLACIANPFRAKAASSKNLLELLTDPDYDHLFSPEQNRVRHAVLPWTRRFQPRFTSYRGETTDLIRLVRDRRADFVLKPAAGFSGRDVSIGCETDPGTWDAVLHNALLAGDWVVQALVPIPEKQVPIIAGDGAHAEPGLGEFRFEPKKVNFGPFAFGGRFGGAMARLSDRSIINVSSGSGVVPTMAVALPANAPVGGETLV